MLLWLAHYLQQYYGGFRVFQYLSFRSIVATLTALAVLLICGTPLIRRLQLLQIGQSIRDDGPRSHLKKQGTPTMGGVLIIGAIAVSMLLWGDWSNRFVWLVMAVLMGFALVGWADDYQKVVKKNAKGLSAKTKFFWQSVIALGVAWICYAHINSPAEDQLFIPFFKQISPHLGAWLMLWIYVVIVGSSNAVNLTDGLDGLAILPSVLVAGALGIFTYVGGNQIYAHYLMAPHIPGIGELTVFCGALVGAGLAFLWFNSYPAAVFMGDVGSLALGGVLGTVAILARQEITLFIMGGIFVLETLSVIIQVLSFKLTGKRVFRMAPLHHHFELKGWPEPKVIVRFWIITFVLVLCGLASLKLR